MSPDTCPVNYTGCSAFSRDRAGSFPICCAVAPGLNVVLVGAEYVRVVLVNTILEVGHTSVTYFDGVLVEYLIERVVCREQLGYYSEELGTYIGLDISGI